MYNIRKGRFKVCIQYICKPPRSSSLQIEILLLVSHYTIQKEWNKVELNKSFLFDERNCFYNLMTSPRVTVYSFLIILSTECSSLLHEVCPTP
jgi:hypothetical protein